MSFGPGEAEGVIARELSCGDLQAQVQTNGSVVVRAGWSKIRVHAKHYACPPVSTEPYEAVYSTADRHACVAGYGCRTLAPDWE